MLLRVNTAVGCTYKPTVATFLTRTSLVRVCIAWYWLVRVVCCLVLTGPVLLLLCISCQCWSCLVLAGPCWWQLGVGWTVLVAAWCWLDRVVCCLMLAGPCWLLLGVDWTVLVAAWCWLDRAVCCLVLAVQCWYCLISVGRVAIAGSLLDSDDTTELYWYSTRWYPLVRNLPYRHWWTELILRGPVCPALVLRGPFWYCRFCARPRII